MRSLAAALLALAALQDPAQSPGVAASAGWPGLVAAASAGAQVTDSGVPSDPAEAFVRANSAYEESDYGRAVELYSAALSEDTDNGRLYYNLGNAYLRNGELGRAIASYRRASALLPNDRDVSTNLAFARNSTQDAIAPPGPSALERALLFWHYGLSRPSLVRWLAVWNVLFWGALAWRLRRPASESIRWLLVAAAIGLAACGGSLLTRIAAPREIAVVIPQEVDVYAGTRADTVVRFKLHAGTEVELVERRGDWLRVSLPDGQQGWLPEEHAEIVRL